MTVYELAARYSKYPTVKTVIGTPLMRVNEFLWGMLPAVVKRVGPFAPYGRYIGRLVKKSAHREQNTSTTFLRNRPEFEMVKTIARRRPFNSTLRIMVLGCSRGAEVYSASWAVQSVRPDLQLEVIGMDISHGALSVARSGDYPDTNGGMVARLTKAEIESMFDYRDGCYSVKAALRRGVQWAQANILSDDLDPYLRSADVVIANRFLCHMDESTASRGFTRVLRLVKPDAYVMVSGIDEDVRERVAREFKLTPVMERLEDVYYGDPSLVAGWPFRYWGLEPIDKKHPHWTVRYAPVFKVSAEAAERLAYATH